MAQLSLSSIRKSFGFFEVIKGVDLDIATGEFVVFVGPSGCGKSTLLRMIAGLEEVTSGRISIDGLNVTQTDPANRQISMVFQSYALFPHMTAAENIGFGLKLAGLPKAEIDRRVSRVAAVLQIESLMERRPRDLSGGQRQRVAIGRAIIRDPKIFLFDEPLSNLDAALRLQLRIEITRLHQRLGATMIYVTHDQVEAMTLADRIVVMNEGRIEQVGDPLTLYEKPANLFVASFIGAPAMNLLDGDVVHEQACSVLSFGRTVLKLERLPCEAGGVTVGVRPEHVSAVSSGVGGARGCVQVLEKLGAESLAYVQTDISQEMVTVRIPSASAVEVGDMLELAFDQRHLHVFDGNGVALNCRGRDPAAAG